MSTEITYSGLPTLEISNRHFTLLLWFEDPTSTPYLFGRPRVIAINKGLQIVLGELWYTYLQRG